MSHNPYTPPVTWDDLSILFYTIAESFNKIQTAPGVGRESEKVLRALVTETNNRKMSQPQRQTLKLLSYNGLESIELGEWTITGGTGHLEITSNVTNNVMLTMTHNEIIIGNIHGEHIKLG